MPERERTLRADDSGASFIAFKLHQFISGAGHAYATLEPAGQRIITVDGQQFLPEHPGKCLYPIHFCRDCGHEYHPVRLADEDGRQVIFARSIDDAPPAADEEKAPDDDTTDREQFGFVTLHPAPDGDFTFDDRDDDYPETWLEHDAAGNPRLKPHYRGARPRQLRVAPDGAVGSGALAWFLPGKFRLCLRCGNTQGGSARDRTRLASLSAEGRSSATTALVASALRWMHGVQSGGRGGGARSWPL